MTFPRKTEGGLLPKRAEDGGGHAPHCKGGAKGQGLMPPKIHHSVILDALLLPCVFVLVHFLYYDPGGLPPSRDMTHRCS